MMKFFKKNSGIVVPTKGELSIPEILRLAKPQKGLTDEVNDWRSDNWKHNVKERGFPQVKWAAERGITTTYGALMLKTIKGGEETDLGLASLRVVTDAGVAFIVNGFLNTTELETMKYHGLGSGSTAEAANQTALTTEFTTQYNPSDNVRATGTLVAFAANVYQTVATNNFDATVAVAEHGIFSQAATGGGTMLDRSQFSTINLASGDGLQSDYRLTFTSGG